MIIEEIRKSDIKALLDLVLLDLIITLDSREE